MSLAAVTLAKEVVPNLMLTVEPRPNFRPVTVMLVPFAPPVGVTLRVGVETVKVVVTL